MGAVKIKSYKQIFSKKSLFLIKYIIIVDIVLLGTSCAPYWYTILPSSALSDIHVCKLSIVLQPIWYHLSGVIYWLITDSFLDRMVFFGFTNWLTLLTTCKWVTNHQIGWQYEFLTNWLIDWLFKCLRVCLIIFLTDWLTHWPI